MAQTPEVQWTPFSPTTAGLVADKVRCFTPTAKLWGSCGSDTSSAPGTPENASPEGTQGSGWSPGEVTNPATSALESVVPLPEACAAALSARVESISMAARRRSMYCDDGDFAPGAAAYELHYYIRYLCCHSYQSAVAHVTAVMLIERLSAVSADMIPTVAGLPKLYLAALSIGVKAAMEYQAREADLAACGGVSVQELAAAERELLTRLDWDVRVPPTEFAAVSASILRESGLSADALWERE